MGCCATVYPRDQQVDNAANRADLVKALKDIIKKYNEEIEDLNSHIKKKTPIKTVGMEGLDEVSIKKRIPYLGAMADSLNEICTTINQSSDDLPLKEAKDLIQNVLGHYYVAYDENNGYAQDAAKFKQFSAAYRKTK